MVLATIFAKWYWTLHKNVTHEKTIILNIFHVFRYHLGNIAIHFIVVLLINLSGIYIDNTKHIIINYGVNILIEFISKSVLIACVITGQNYLSSLQYLLVLILKKNIRLVIIVFMSNTLCCLMQIAVIAFSMLLMYTLMITNSIDVVRMMMVAFIGGISYMITSFVLHVYFIAVATIILCYFEDLQRNDGKIDNPYYMTDKMLESSGKHNVIGRHKYFQRYKDMHICNN